MKKVTTIFKTMLMVAVVFVMAQGCVPTGGPTPSGTLVFEPWVYSYEFTLTPFLSGTYDIEIYNQSNILTTSRQVQFGDAFPWNQYFTLNPGLYHIKMKRPSPNNTYIYNHDYYDPGYYISSGDSTQVEITIY